MRHASLPRPQSIVAARRAAVVHSGHAGRVPWAQCSAHGAQDFSLLTLRRGPTQNHCSTKLSQHDNKHVHVATSKSERMASMATDCTLTTAHNECVATAASALNRDKKRCPTWMSTTRWMVSQHLTQRCICSIKMTIA